MISQRAELPIVALSVKVYQALLVAYPTKFQQEYGEEMVQVFQDCCLRALRQGGRNGMLNLWMVTLFDFIQSVISEHAQKEIEMKKEMKPEDIRRAGWALILAAVSFVLSVFIAIMLTGGWDFAIFLFMFVSLPLLVYGVLGLRQRYGEKVGSFGKNILLVGAILGPLTSLIGFFLFRTGMFSFVPFIGPATLFTCLTLYGVVAFITRPMPNWNILPIFAGLCYPAIIFYLIGTSYVTGYWESNHGLSNSLIIILLAVQGIALAALGYNLKSDVPEETVVPA